MIRPFDLRDVTLVAQLEKQGTSLNAELTLTQKPRPLQAALASFLSLRNLGTRTYICRGSYKHDGKHEGLAQLQPVDGTTRGHVILVAPTLAQSNGADAIWLDLLEYVGVEAASMGLLHLIAEAPEDGDEVEVLRKAGFAIYVRQDILQLDAARIPSTTAGALRESEDVDTWAIQQLYFNTAPRLAHLAEGVPLAVDQPNPHWSYVYKEQDNLVAYLEIQSGSLGAWFNILVHPDAESRAAQIVSEGLARLGSSWNKPIFCGVRRYQEWLRRPLESLGFEPFGSSVSMVKHLAAHVIEPHLAKAQSAVLKRAKTSTPSLTRN